jgi:hypothetical protein
MKTTLNTLILLMFILLLASCKPQYQEDYEKKSLELDIKMRQLDYIKELYYVRTDIEFQYKIKTLDSLINLATQLPHQPITHNQ